MAVVNTATAPAVQQLGSFAGKIHTALAHSYFQH